VRSSEDATAWREEFAPERVRWAQRFAVLTVTREEKLYARQLLALMPTGPKPKVHVAREEEHAMRDTWT
jgi:hypothetical protein